MVIRSLWKIRMPNWNDVLREINTEQAVNALNAQTSLNRIRKKYLQLLYEKTQRNVISYYSGFLSKPNINSSINDEDKNGFMMAIHNLDRSKGLDLILHTPGGDIAATESIVDYLQRMFETDIRAVVPQIAMSAGTMLACACKEILMAKHSNLGPIDPHLGGIPAHGVIAEFKRAYEEVKQDSAKAIIWSQIISKYNPTFLGQCENAIKWSEEFVGSQLKKVMFKNDSEAENKSAFIVSKLGNFHENKTHARHINIDECKEMNLKINEIEDDQDLQDLILTVHHTYMHTLMNTQAYKIIENQNGVAFVKQQVGPIK